MERQAGGDPQPADVPGGEAVTKLHIGEWILGHQKSDYSERISFALYQVREDGERVVLSPRGKEWYFQVVPAGETIQDPSFTLERDQIQAFMDTLWEMGARPKARRFDDEMKLMDNHLQDMRRLVFTRIDLAEQALQEVRGRGDAQAP